MPIWGRDPGETRMASLTINGKTFDVDVRTGYAAVVGDSRECRPDRH